MPPGSTALLRDATTVAVVAGPLVLLGYLLGSIPFRWLLDRARFRRQLSSTTRADANGADAANDTTGRGASRLRPALGPLLEAAAALVAATIAWQVSLAVSPGGAGVQIGGPDVSAVGFYSAQALAAWQSVALWAGAAAVVGTVAPVWLRFRGSDGLVPAAALTVAYAPLVFAIAAVTAASVALAARRHAPAVLAALAAAVTGEWVAWIGDWPAGWGDTNGPELALWTTVVAGVVCARHLTRR